MDWKRIFGGSSKAVTARAAGPGRWTSGSAGCDSGSRKYLLWVPAGHNPGVPSPLLMMLHGCRQKPAELAEISGVNEIADQHNFLVVYPEQTIKGNLLRCWNWFEARHRSRGAGEPAILAAVVEQVQLSHNADPERIYVAGISAGAAMAVIMGATYPDIFAGIGTVAGLEFAAADGVIAGLRAMQHGGPDPNQQGIAAFEAMSLAKNGRRRMPVIVFQGTNDSTVHSVNADQLVTQWAVTNQLLGSGSDPAGAAEVTQGRVTRGYSYQKHAYKDDAGRLLIEKWVVEGLGHAWPGSPVAVAYADPKGPDATGEMWRFFSQTADESLAESAGLKGFWSRSLSGLRETFAGLLKRR
jgi:poly(hydroxyalkanoate) depolymerase family esterase